MLFACLSWCLRRDSGAAEKRAVSLFFVSISHLSLSLFLSLSPYLVFLMCVAHCPPPPSPLSLLLFLSLSLSLSLSRRVAFVSLLFPYSSSCLGSSRFPHPTLPHPTQPDPTRPNPIRPNPIPSRPFPIPYFPGKTPRNKEGRFSALNGLSCGDERPGGVRAACSSLTRLRSSRPPADFQFPSCVRCVHMHACTRMRDTRTLFDSRPIMS